MQPFLSESGQQADREINRLPDLARNLARARTAQERWAERSIRERLQPIHAFRRLVAARCTELCGILHAELGKPPVETISSELIPLAEACRFLQRRARRVLRARREGMLRAPTFLLGIETRVQRRPWGVVGIIGTWNYPLFLNCNQILQAVAAGNAVLWKPSEVAPAAARAVHELFQAAGFPAGLIQTLENTRAAGEQLSAAAIDYLVFTGSAATGRRVAQALAERLVPSTLELSGCDALFVLAGAPPEAAAHAAWFGMMLNRGQTCLAIRRVLVHRSLSDRFNASLSSLVRQAAPVRLATRAQVESAEGLVQDALARGGRLAGREQGARGSDVSATATRNGQAELFLPTVILDARPEMDLWRRDCFAPLLAVSAFETIEEALALHDACSYGLGASIFGDPETGRRLAGRLRVGTVSINDALVPVAHPATPFGGRNQSGWGVTQGEEGLLSMTVPQTVAIRRAGPRVHFRMTLNGGRSLEGLLRGLLLLEHGGSLGSMLRGVGGMFRRSRTKEL